MKSRKNIKNVFSTIGDKHLKFIKQVPYRTHDRLAQNQKKKNDDDVNIFVKQVLQHPCDRLK